MAPNEDPVISPFPRRETVFFERRELELILRLYGQGVASGAWRDYGLEQESEFVAFCIFKRSSEAPLYRIEKRPALRHKQGAFAIYNQNQLILKRGRELDGVLEVLIKKKLNE